jgi:hypothetical protein
MKIHYQVAQNLLQGVLQVLPLASVARLSMELQQCTLIPKWCTCRLHTRLQDLFH